MAVKRRNNRQSRQIRLDAVLPNAGVKAAYLAALLDMIRRMHGHVSNRLIARYLQEYGVKTNKGTLDEELEAEIEPFQSEFDYRAEQIASAFVKSAGVHSLNALLARFTKAGVALSVAGQEIVGKTPGTAQAASPARVIKWFTPQEGLVSPVAMTRLGFMRRSTQATLNAATRKSYETLTQAYISENVALIRSIPKRYHEQIRAVVRESLAKGNEPEWLAAQLYDIGGITTRRANLIASDQTNKIFEEMTRERVKAAGIKKGIWLHMGFGKHDRPTHVEMDGREFDLDKGMWDKDVGRYIFPGELPFCYCSFKPLLEGDVVRDWEYPGEI